MLKFCRIIETAGHQFLLRRCDEAGLVGISSSEFDEHEAVSILTIDTVSEQPEKGHVNMRMALECQDLNALSAIFHAFTAADCQWVLPVMQKMYAGEVDEGKMYQLLAGLEQHFNQVYNLDASRDLLGGTSGGARPSGPEV